MSCQSFFLVLTIWYVIYGDGQPVPQSIPGRCADVKLETFTNKLDIPPLGQSVFFVNLDITATTTTAAGVGDGNDRPIVAVNGRIPGPTIVVWQDSKVYMNVRNFLSEGTTIHVHGFDQRENFWYDGVPEINQCPIPPGGSFQYEFKAIDHPGTYWYHSHVPPHVGDGCYGAFIILDRSKYLDPTKNPQEFVVFLQDWWKEPTEQFDNADNTLPTMDATGAMSSDLRFYSALVNGKGQKHLNGTPSVLPGALMEVFQAQSCQNAKRPIRLRVISAGIMWTMSLQVAGHRLRFLASDAQDMALPYETFDSVFINTGERYDLELVPLHAASAYNGFRIKIGTSADSIDLESSNVEDLSLWYSEALIDCSGSSPPSRILETQISCTAEAKCQVLNCPFKDFPASHNKVCTNPHHYKALNNIPDELLRTPHSEMFLNIGTIESLSFFNINGIKMTMPTFPPYEQMLKGGNVADVITTCEDGCGDTQKCECFKPITFGKGKLNQVVVYNKFDRDETSAVNAPNMGHPIHFHATHAYVLKVGYPSYDANGKVDQVEQDVVCYNEICTNGNFSTYPTDLNLKNPPFKDTVFVPSNGYVVFRFISDNVGWFVLHCHMVIHEGHGLMAPLKIGTDEEIQALVLAKRPSYYNSCYGSANGNCCGNKICAPCFTCVNGTCEQIPFCIGPPIVIG